MGNFQIFFREFVLIGQTAEVAGYWSSLSGSAKQHTKDYGRETRFG